MGAKENNVFGHGAATDPSHLIRPSLVVGSIQKIPTGFL